MLSSPYTWAQFLKVVVHFFVASKVERYSAFSNALSLGNTLLWRLSFLYVEFKLSMALVVYITFRTVSENLKIGDITSQLSFHLFMEFGYFGVHFSVTLSNASRAFSSLTAWYIVLRSFAKAFLSLSGTYLRVFLTWWTMHLWYSVFGKAADIASFMPLKPSAHITRMSFTPRFYN